MRALILITLLLAVPASAHPLDGRIWDTKSRSFVSVDSAYERAAASRYVLLGEKHDNEVHHRLQLDTLQALAARQRKPALAMEQFDSEQQAALAAAQAGGVTDPEQLADAGKLNREGWGWPMYKDLIAYAAGRGWPLVAANLSRLDARAIATGKVKPALPAASAALVAAVENEIVLGHCGQRPPEDRLAAIVTAQRARDARIAAALDGVAGPAVLIAGSGHVRRDRAAPHYLKDGRDVLAIAYVEVADDKALPGAYDGEGFDLLWFTARKDRPDPCATPLGGTVAPASAKADKEKP